MIVFLMSLALIGCQSVSPPVVDRESRLLTLAAAEAQQIPDARQRLTRQLNFAARQLQGGKFDEAKQSLAYASTTLLQTRPADLQPQIRIAGWVSISELSRAANDKATAQTACEEAVAVLKSLNPVSERPQYVIGVASEVQTLQGKAAAAKLLGDSADWVKQMQGQLLQRVALVSICDAIFDDGDFDAGLATLRADPDAIWRSDTLAMLAERDRNQFRDADGNVVAITEHLRNVEAGSNIGNAAVPGVPANPQTPFQPYSITQNASTPAPTPLGIQGFGKPVDFQRVFAGRNGVSDGAATNP
jgi:hypothetical protein